MHLQAFSTGLVYGGILGVSILERQLVNAQLACKMSIQTEYKRFINRIIKLDICIAFIVVIY